VLIRFDPFSKNIDIQDQARTDLLMLQVTRPVQDLRVQRYLNQRHLHRNELLPIDPTPFQHYLLAQAEGDLDSAYHAFEIDESNNPILLIRVGLWGTSNRPNTRTVGIDVVNGSTIRVETGLWPVQPQAIHRPPAELSLQERSVLYPAAMTEYIREVGGGDERILPGRVEIGPISIRTTVHDLSPFGGQVSKQVRPRTVWERIKKC